MLQRSVRQAGQTIVMVTHDPVAASYADRVLFLADGRVVGELHSPTADAVAERMTHLGACGGLIETGIRAAAPPQQLASADVVVAGYQTHLAPGADPNEPAILTERVRVDAGLSGARASSARASNETVTLVGDERGRAELREATATSVNVVSLAGAGPAKRSPRSVRAGHEPRT